MAVFGSETEDWANKGAIAVFVDNVNADDGVFGVGTFREHRGIEVEIDGIARLEVDAASISDVAASDDVVFDTILVVDTLDGVASGLGNKNLIFAQSGVGAMT